MIPPQDNDDDETAEIEAPATPDCDMSDDEVAAGEFQYSTRHPDDWVSSGPLGDSGTGPGRPFASWKHAEYWAKKFYGVRLKGRINEAAIEGGNRYAFLIRGPRG